MSEQPLTAFTKLSYGKQDFAKAEGHKTKNGEEDTHPQKGGGRVKICTLAKKGKRERNHGIDDLNSKRTPPRLPHRCNTILFHLLGSNKRYIYKVKVVTCLGFS